MGIYNIIKIIIARENATIKEATTITVMEITTMVVGRTLII